MSVGVLLGSLEIVETTGNSSVPRVGGSAKKLLECSVLTASEGSEELKIKDNGIREVTESVANTYLTAASTNRP